MRRFAVLPLPLVLAAGCSAPPLPPESRDPDLASVARGARLAYEAGTLERAERLYREALDRARAMDDPELIATEAYNLAVCLLETRRYEPAEAALREAAAEARRTGMDARELTIASAKLAYLQGRPREAAALVDSITAEAREPDDAVRFEAHVLKARLALDAADLTGARMEAEAAEKAGGDPPPPGRRAKVAGIRGRLLLAEGRPGPAAVEFDREADGFREAGRFADMIEALERAGEAHAGSGSPVEAADRFYRAGRALAGKRVSEAALPLIERAVAEAAKGGDKDLKARISDLLDEVISGTDPGTRPH
jgi:tetratricopeptide (TPR) repeat protein